MTDDLTATRGDTREAPDERHGMSENEAAAEWRAVRKAEEREGRGSVLGPDTNRRLRWWELTLSCGHVVERNFRYGPRTRGHAGGPRSFVDALPAPRRVRCVRCAPEAGGRNDGGHWLTFDDDRRISGCHCGFVADIDSDCGWGDSVVEHLLSLTADREQATNHPGDVLGDAAEVASEGERDE